MATPDWNDRSHVPFGPLLLRFRTRAGLTQRQLASRVGVSMRTIQGWETGVAYPGAPHLKALLGALLEVGGLSAGSGCLRRRNYGQRRAANPRVPTHLYEQHWFIQLLADRSPPPGRTAAPTFPCGRRHCRFSVRNLPSRVTRTGGTLRTCRLRRSRCGDGHHTSLGAARPLPLRRGPRHGWCRKSSVASKLAHNVAPAFDRTYWRSLRNAPPLSEWLASAIGFLSGQQLVPPDREEAQLELLVRLIRERPSLLVLDNFETLLRPGESEGRYRDDYEGYARLVQAVSASATRVASW
jgi:transcriptional regulator with XRE-family HTH domain